MLFRSPQIKISKKEIIKPRNDTDSKLVQILKDLLNINSISIDDSFFELGGDSLYAINLSIKIKDKFNVQISSKDILENPIIQDLSDIISTKNSITENKTIKKIPEAEFYKISSAQKRIYCHHPDIHLLLSCRPVAFPASGIFEPAQRGPAAVRRVRRRPHGPWRRPGPAGGRFHRRAGYPAFDPQPVFRYPRLSLSFCHRYPPAGLPGRNF